MFGVFLIFNGEITLYTISLYYYTGMRDVLVGALCAIALFMFFYKGHDKWDDRVGKGSDPTQQKLKRNKIYIICGLIMIACLISIMIYFNFFQDTNPKSSFVFWAETIALVAFGVSWLTKGGTLYPDKKT